MLFGGLEGVFGDIQIFDNFDFQPENYLLGFEAGRSIKSYRHHTISNISCQNQKQMLYKSL